MLDDDAGGRERVGQLWDGDIAYRFDLRHRRADQRSEHDEAFLDLIFWWYLATVELTNRLIASRAPA
ncbi:hypothetical protein [Streptomyces sp. NPDC048425]|uniref:hypothetical protein n=1 Tax=Streptomyces sp. NPDC048425 TaxID=3365548 RepID=UPI003722A7CB